MPRGRVAGGVQREGGTEAERAGTCSACVSVSLPKAAKVPQGALTQRLLCSGSSKIRVCVCGVGGESSAPEQKGGRKDHIKTSTCLIKEA